MKHSSWLPAILSLAAVLIVALFTPILAWGLNIGWVSPASAKSLMSYKGTAVATGAVLLLIALLLTDRRRGWRAWMPSMIALVIVIFLTTGLADPTFGKSELTDPAGRIAFTDRLRMDEYVLGISINNAAKAYPLELLKHSPVVNDSLGGQTFLIVFCSSCNSALVYAVNDPAIGPFEITGLLHGDPIVADAHTGTWWHSLAGEALVGPLQGQKLTLLPMQTVTWQEWRAKHPDTLLVLPEARSQSR